jgi:membrane protein
MFGRLWRILRDTVEGFIADEALTRAASIAYFALFSLGPLLFIASGVAGIVFGPEQVSQALAHQLESLLGRDPAGAVSRMVENALGDAQGPTALLIGLVTLVITASGAFGALQSALNAIWKVEAPAEETTVATISNFVRAKAAAMGLVASTGFLLLVSLAASAALAALGDWLKLMMPSVQPILAVLNFTLSLAITALLFGAIYKVLPDRKLEWRDVMVGAIATAILFTLGKSLIGLYIGTIEAARTFGAAGTIAVVLLWLYYSALIFLLGAEFTRAWSGKEVADPKQADALNREFGPSTP